MLTTNDPRNVSVKDETGQQQKQQKQHSQHECRQAGHKHDISVDDYDDDDAALMSC
jgi:hypothetical protein